MSVATEESTATATIEAPSSPAGVHDAIQAIRDRATTAAPAAPVAEDTPADEPMAAETPAAEAEDDAPADDAGAPADDDTEDDDPAEGDEPEAGSDDDVFVFSLPGRKPGDPDEEIDLDGLTKEQREGFLRLRKGYLRGEQARALREEVEEREALVAAARDKIIAIEDGIQADPAAFIASRVTNRDIRATVVVDFLVDLLDDDSEEARAAYEKILDQVQELEADEVRRENYKLKREQSKPKVPDARPDEPQIDSDTQRVLDHVRSIPPAGTDSATSAAFMEDVLRDIQRRVIKAETEGEVDEIVTTSIARYRRAYGFSDPSADESNGDTSTGAKGKRAAPATQSASQARSDPQDTGKRLATVSARRREAVTSPAGGGAPSVAAEPVLKKGAGLSDAIEALKRNIGR